MKALQVSGTWLPKPDYEPTEREKRDRRAVSGDRIFSRPGVGFVEIPVPEPKDDEVLMRVGGVGVCGSDTTFLGEDEQGYSRYAGHCKLPCVIGHEFAGEVVKVGKDVTMFQPGDLVTAETMNWCGECEACRMGMYNQCENLEEIGFTLDGGYAEYLVAKEKFCFDISALEDIYGSRRKALHIGALIEPLAVAYNGMFVRGGGFLPGSDVVIFGAGPIGLSALSLAIAGGAGKVIVFEKSVPRMELAEKIGASYVCDIDELKKEGSSPGRKVLELTGGKGADVFIEATEFQRFNIPEIEQALAVGAKVIQTGISSRTAEMDIERLQIKGASYHGTIGSAGHGIWQNVIQLIAQKRVDPDIYLNPRIYTLDEALEAIKDAAKCENGKNVVDPSLKA